MTIYRVTTMKARFTASNPVVNAAQLYIPIEILIRYNDKLNATNRITKSRFII